MSIDDGLASVQLCQFCVFYARGGDETFRARLREVVTLKPDPLCPWLGEEELVDLDGDAGFLFAARVHGELQPSKEWDWDDRSFIDVAIAKLGEPAIIALLESASPSSPALKRFYDGWRIWTERKLQEPRQSHADRMRQIPLSTVIQVAEGSGNQAGLL